MMWAPTAVAQFWQMQACPLAVGGKLASNVELSEAEAHQHSELHALPGADEAIAQRLG